MKMVDLPSFFRLNTINNVNDPSEGTFISKLSRKV